MTWTPPASSVHADRTGKPREHGADVKTINLALQGGGAHGAFTWGVLDRLLEDERIAFEGVSATSAGAMNAVVLAYGLAEGGRDGARKALTDFWLRVSHAAAMGPLQPSPIDRASAQPRARLLAGVHDARLHAAGCSRPTSSIPPTSTRCSTCSSSRSTSPRLRELAPVKLFLSATNVRTGKVKIFTEKEITADAVMASACLPFMFQAVEIDGEAYWDGGYMGNPAIYPLSTTATARTSSLSTSTRSSARRSRAAPPRS